MYIPNLENVYQTISKQRDILNKQRAKINYIKMKLGSKIWIKNANQEKHNM